MSEQEKIYTMALSRLNYFSLAGIVELYKQLGSATAVMEHRNDIREVLPDASMRLVEALQNVDETVKKAEDEYLYSKANGIQVLCMNDEIYPQRMTECVDAPLVLFYKGSANLNKQRVISIVGTRHSTAYGQDVLRRFMRELRELCPEVLVVSGLAYGIDICAHREALANGYPTVGVLAHGLDELYPPRHRNTADEMVKNGGLLTEFYSCTRVEKVNFVRRNRIVAGISDVTILVESAAKGGGLITTRIAQDYNREVFAVPGAIGFQYSEGCNQLIRNHGAELLTSASDFVESMGWECDRQQTDARKMGIERQMFPELSEEEQQIVEKLSRQNDLQINILTVQTGMSISKLTALLFSLEMKGVVRPMAGGTYHLIM